MYLVDQIGNVVDDVQQAGVDGTSEEAEEIAEGVDGPANSDDGTPKKNYQQVCYKNEPM